jgi:hypothetical protein
MDPGDVFMVESRGYLLGEIRILLTFWIVLREDSNMLHDHLIRLCFESIDLKSSQAEHLVMIFSIVDWDQAGEELGFILKRVIYCYPILAISHSFEYNYLINC